MRRSLFSLYRRKFSIITLYLDNVWKSWQTGATLCTVGLFTAFWANHSHFLPGISIGLLAAAAAIMSIRPEMGFPEKLCWAVILGFFLVAEIHSIANDRTSNDKQAAADRTAQNQDFERVLDAQKKAFELTASGLTTAIGGIQSTLTAADITLKQTQPNAAIAFQSFGLTTPVPVPLKANQDIPINFHWINTGTATAYDESYLLQMYVAKANDEMVQKQLAAQFKIQWDSGKEDPV